jgi:response regulator RpfG family c-di-GMP phosphodiesterase
MKDPDATHKPPDPVLLVDDEAAILTLLRDELEQAGYATVGVTSPLQALEQIRQRNFSVIISDQRMPELSGLEFLAQAARIQPQATRMLITGVMEVGTVIEAINKGEIFRFIVKPWLREEFLAAVKNGVQRHELILQNSHLQSATQSMNEQLIELNRSLEQQVKLVAQKNLQLHDLNGALEDNLLHSMELCVHTMETFYPLLGNRARRVFQLCRSISHVLQLSGEDTSVLESSALLYDIGLVGVPRQIIRHWQEAPHSLSQAEKTLVEQHPILGQELIAFGSDLETVGKIIRAHHENFDGSGYPDQLSAANIPWLARLLAVAVAYVSNPYTDVEAMEQLKAGAGATFDPEAVRIFLRAHTVAVIPRKERHLSLAELRPGMVLAKGIHTYNGLLLVSQGQKLNATYIEKVLNHNRIQPITDTVVIYC